MEITLQEKIIALWIVFLLGMLFHTQLALMPLFHGLKVAESQLTHSSFCTAKDSPVNKDSSTLRFVL